LLSLEDETMMRWWSPILLIKARKYPPNEWNHLIISHLVEITLMWIWVEWNLVKLHLDLSKRDSNIQILIPAIRNHLCIRMISRRCSKAIASSLIPLPVSPDSRRVKHLWDKVRKGDRLNPETLRDHLLELWVEIKMLRDWRKTEFNRSMSKISKNDHVDESDE